jgi:hypothetical protein
MTPARWQQIEEVYESALRLEREGRAAFLEEACGADEQLRHEVDSLLALSTSTKKPWLYGSSVSSLELVRLEVCILMTRSNCYRHAGDLTVVGPS